MPLLLEVIILVGVLGGVALVVSGRVEPMREDPPDRRDPHIPPAGVEVRPEDVDAIRFGLAFRGYRMDEVDAAMQRLREELVGLRARLDGPAEEVPLAPAADQGHGDPREHR